MGGISRNDVKRQKDTKTKEGREGGRMAGRMEARMDRRKK